MDDGWTCTLCKGPIGGEEPMLVLEGHDARWSSPADEPPGLSVSALFHEGCAPLPWQRSSS